MDKNPALRVRIEGRVQGVGYRYWLIEQAANFGLDGWVRNRRDGHVEAVFRGPQAALEQILGRCYEGPTLARVNRVLSEPEMGEVEPGFHALPSE